MMDHTFSRGSASWLKLELSNCAVRWAILDHLAVKIQCLGVIVEIMWQKNDPHPVCTSTVVNHAYDARLAKNKYAYKQSIQR